MLVASTPRDLVATYMSECVCLSSYLSYLCLPAYLSTYLSVCLSMSICVTVQVIMANVLRRNRGRMLELAGTLAITLRHKNT